MSRDLYRVLQVDPGADAEVLEAAYRRLARKFHPDLNPAPDAGQRMRELNEAYGILRHPDRRAMYDAERAAPPPLEPVVVVTPPRRQPKGSRRLPRSQPPPARVTRPQIAWQGAPTFWRRLSKMQSAHRLIILGAVGALVLTALIGAYAARLFEPTDRPAVAAGGSPAVVVTRIPTAEPSATARPPAAATPAAWPPFVYIPVPILSVSEETTPAASPTAGLESRP